MNLRCLTTATLIAFELSAQSAARSAAAQGLPRSIDQDMNRALVEFRVPGMALAVIKDGRVILSKGYGVKKVGDPAPITPNTLFQIASNTKAFTTALISMLQEDGKLNWDDPVQKYLPYFQLYDPWVTREFTIRDLVTHRSGMGLGAGDLLWFHSNYSRDEISRRIRAAKPVTSFRSAYAYDNVLYIVAGELVAAAAGKPWDDVVRERIFQPLGMSQSVTTTAQFLAGDWAVPHAVVDSQVVVIPIDTADNIAPAGGISSNLTDLTKWVMMQLDSGKVGRQRLFSSRMAQMMWSGHTIKPIDDVQPILQPLLPNFFEYALGWNLRDYRGRKLVYHTGGLAGMTSEIMMVPSERLGIIILTNSESAIHNAVTFRVLDAMLGAQPTDWIGAFSLLERQAGARSDSAVRAMAAARDSMSQPSLALARYAGAYTDSLYGDATITLEKDALVLRFARSPAFTGPLVHWQHDTFIAKWRTAHIEDAFVQFALNPDGSIDSFKMSAVSPLADFSFDYQDLLFRPKAR